MEGAASGVLDAGRLTGPLGIAARGQGGKAQPLILPLWILGALRRRRWATGHRCSDPRKGQRVLSKEETSACQADGNLVCDVQRDGKALRFGDYALPRGRSKEGGDRELVRTRDGSFPKEQKEERTLLTRKGIVAQALGGAVEMQLWTR
ncbi:hypothetical protein NDU88_003794 [Pleurodeles waltl]|uniref:Uncharacterized protein n=1 Tax=Pleurodeles waltl TaxID=8319 RepID=A0AAV7NHP5_PLEWA|nr:hypothetical protein NDU88_003794 [Pleurodeles waltl]